MGETSSSVNTNGIGFWGLLQIVLITLKLAEIGTVANWPWMWVLSPILLGVSIIVIMFGIGIFAIALAAIYDYFIVNKRRG